MKEKRSVIVFLVIVFVLSAIVDYFWIRGGQAASAAGISALLMWCPAVAAFIVRMVYYRKEKLLGFNGCKPVYLLVAFAAPILYCAVSYGMYWLLTPGSFTGSLNLNPPMAAAYGGKAGSSTVFTIIVLLVGFVMSNITAMGEEIGWRGFMLPQMVKIWNVKTAVIVSGLIWAVWHMPIMLAGLYNPGTPWWYQLPMFTLDILAFTVIISVLRLKSGSVWPAILIHASHNYFDQAIFGPLTAGPNQAWFVSETGFLFVAAVILVAVLIVRLFWKPGAQAGELREVTAKAQS